MVKTKAQKAKRKAKRKAKKAGARSAVKTGKRGGIGTTVSGRGAYSLRQAGRDVTGFAESVAPPGFNVGNAIGNGLGGLIGRGLNSLWSWISGRGAYSVKKNSFMNAQQAPKFSGRFSADGTFEFAHSEFLTDITTAGGAFSTNFTCSINPGLVVSYPFFSRLAVNFEEYEILGQLYQFKSTSGDSIGSTNTALGTVIMSTNYDVLDVPFANKQEMEAYMFTTSCKPSESMLHPIECARGANVLSQQYVRAAAPPTGSDPRFYDIGLFQLATVGMQAASTIGELWVTYHFRMLKPKLQSPLGDHLLGFHAHEYPVGSADAGNPFGTGPVGSPRVYPGNTLTFSGDNDHIVLPVIGRYLINFVWYTDATLTSGGSISIGSNLQVVFFWGLQSTYSTSTFDRTAGAAAEAKAARWAVVDVLTGGTTSDNEVAIVGPSGMTAASTDIVVQQISGGMSMPVGPFTKRANLLDDMIDRLQRLELENKKMKENAWGCAGSLHSEPFVITKDKVSDFLKNGQNSSSSSTEKKEKATSLSDSVVDLIAAKLRK